jgi:hypothetical protein
MRTRGLDGQLSPARQLTSQQRATRKSRAVELRRQGWSYRAIAIELGCGSGTAFRILNEDTE